MRRGGGVISIMKPKKSGGIWEVVLKFSNSVKM